MVNDETFLVACSSGPLSPRTIKFTRFLASYKPGRKPGRKQVEGMSKACRKPAANLLKTGFFLHSSTRTNQRTCCGSRPGFRQKSRKRVANPHELVGNLAANLVETTFAARFAAGYNNEMRPLATILTSAKLIVNLIFSSTTA